MRLWNVASRLSMAGLTNHSGVVCATAFCFRREHFSGVARLCVELISVELPRWPNGEHRRCPFAVSMYLLLLLTVQCALLHSRQLTVS
jgi:hypothetical protein